MKMPREATSGSEERELSAIAVILSRNFKQSLRPFASEVPQLQYTLLLLSSHGKEARK